MKVRIIEEVYRSERKRYVPQRYVRVFWKLFLGKSWCNFYFAAHKDDWGTKYVFPTLEAAKVFLENRIKKEADDVLLESSIVHEGDC